MSKRYCQLDIGTRLTKKWRWFEIGIPYNNTELWEKSILFTMVKIETFNKGKSSRWNSKNMRDDFAIYKSDDCE